MFKADRSFWAHEWARHGTCATSVFPNEHAFFAGVLDLHQRYDLDVCPSSHMPTCRGTDSVLTQQVA